MDSGIEPLAHLIIETPAREAVHGGLFTHIIAMRDEYLFALGLDNGAPIEDGHVQLIAQVVEQPHIVIAGDPRELHASISELGELAQETDVAAGNHILVLVPIVQDVAQQVELGRIVLDTIQKTAHAALTIQLVAHVFRPQMEV